MLKDLTEFVLKQKKNTKEENKKGNSELCGFGNFPRNKAKILCFILYLL